MTEIVRFTRKYRFGRILPIITLNPVLPPSSVGGRRVVLPPLSVGEMTLRLYGALNYSRNSVRDLRCALNGA